MLSIKKKTFQRYRLITASGKQMLVNQVRELEEDGTITRITYAKYRQDSNLSLQNMVVQCCQPYE